MTRVLWGTPKGAESWQEQVITETDSAVHMAKARCWAVENGFTNLRVQVLDGKVPDFGKTVRQ